MHFLLRLHPPRPDFPTTMTPAEGALMAQHGVYLRKLLAKGKLLLAGPVFDPAGAFGIAILEVENAQEALDIVANDPTVIAGMNTCDAVPMNAGIMRESLRRQ